MKEALLLFPSYTGNTVYDLPGIRLVFLIVLVIVVLRIVSRYATSSVNHHAFSENWLSPALLDVFKNNETSCLGAWKVIDNSVANGSCKPDDAVTAKVAYVQWLSDLETAVVFVEAKEGSGGMLEYDPHLYNLYPLDKTTADTSCPCARSLFTEAFVFAGKSDSIDAMHQSFVRWARANKIMPGPKKYFVGPVAEFGASEDGKSLGVIQFNLYEA